VVPIKCQGGVVKIGDLVKYMSRTLLVVGLSEGKWGPGWIECIELGESEIGTYRKSKLKVISESR
jgi:hypothetical protein